MAKPGPKKKKAPWQPKTTQVRRPGAGRKPKPAAIARLQGRKMPAEKRARLIEGNGELYAPPPWFDAQQREQWDYAIKNSPKDLLTASDRELLISWCCASLFYAEAVQRVRDDGAVIYTKNRGPVMNPYVQIMNKQVEIMLKTGNEMGFTPVSRAQLSRLPRPVRPPLDGEKPQLEDAGVQDAQYEVLENFLAEEPSARLDH